VISSASGATQAAKKSSLKITLKEEKNLKLIL